MTVYLDTSVIFRSLMGEKGAFSDWDRLEKIVTSELSMVEALRSLDRLRLGGKILDLEVSEKMMLLREMFHAFAIINLNREVLNRASEAFPTVVATLDAIHLASADVYRDRNKGPLSFFTHDLQLGTAARALGFEVQGVSLS